MGFALISLYVDNNKNILAYNILNKDTFEVMSFDMLKLMLFINEGNEVQGVEIGEGSTLVASCGSFDRYSMIYNNIPLNGSRAVILKEMVDNKYQVSNHVGKVVIASESTLIEYGKSEGLANAKIVNKDGTEFISAIKGEFEKDKMFKLIDSGKNVENKLKLIGMDCFKITGDKTIARGSKDRDEFIIPKGITTIDNAGFEKSNCIKIQLPSTVSKIGKRAFYECKYLEEINIPDGVKIIEAGTFEGCISLKRIELPNSVVKIDRLAFAKCGNITIVIGKNRVDIHPSAIDRTAKIIRR